MRLDTFPRNFPLDGEVANLLQTCYTDLLRGSYGETGVMDFGIYAARLRRQRSAERSSGSTRYRRPQTLTRCYEISIRARILFLFTSGSVLMTMSDTGGNRRSLTRSSLYLLVECLELGLVRAAVNQLQLSVKIQACANYF